MHDEESMKRFGTNSFQGRNYRTLIRGCLFIYSCSAGRQISFEFELNSKEISRA